MPGASPYIHDALLGLQLLGGVLATPSLEAADENQQTQQQKLLALAQGNPSSATPVSPGLFSANRPGLYGGILSGVGGLGQVLSTLGGNPVKAPRYDTTAEELEAAKLGRQKAQDDAAQTLFTDPTAKGLYNAGLRASAVKKQYGMDNASAPSLARAIGVLTDPAASPADKARAQQQYDLHIKAAAASAGARATAVDPIQAAAETRRAGVTQGTKAQQDMQGGNLVDRYIGKGPDGTYGVQRQSTPSLLEGEATGHVQTIADFAPQVGDQPGPGQPGLVPRSARKESGTGSVDFGLPDKATETADLMARSMGIDPRAMTTADATALRDNLTDYQLRQKRAEAAITQNAQGIPEQDRAVVTGLLTTQDLVHRAMTEFTPDQRAKYVGILRQPALEWKQMVSTDPDFARWNALVAQIEAAKFDFGGKQLTGPEAALVEKFIPQGREMGGQVEFDAKANEFTRSAADRIRTRLSLIGSRGDVRSAVDDRLGGAPPPASKPWHDFLDNAGVPP